MKRIEVSLAGLLLALVAVEVAALRSAADEWVDACRFLTVATLVVATILARRRSGEVGSFWFGFALGGWATYALVLDASRYSSSILDKMALLTFYSISDFMNPINEYEGSERVLRATCIVKLMLTPIIGLLGGLLGLLHRSRRRGVMPDHATLTPAPSKDMLY